MKGTRPLLAGVLAAALAGPSGAGPQEPDLLEVARPATIYVADRPTVTVQFSGDFGPSRVTGVLDQTAGQPLRLTDAAGATREVSWTAVRALAQVRSAAEGLPLGSFTASLTSEPQAPGAGGSYLTPGLAVPGPGQAAWKAAALPEGSLTLTSAVLGRLAIAIPRITSFQQEPLRGSVLKMPEGMIRLELVRGTVVNLPLAQVEYFRRDTAAGTAAVGLGDGQTFTGRLVELPKATITLESKETVALERVVLLEIGGPNSSRALGGRL